MSTENPKAMPRRPGPRRERLDSISNPQPRPPPGLQRRKEPLKCPDPNCKSEGFSEEDSKLICLTCGAVVTEFTMVTDVQYGLTSGGRHVVHGHHVGSDQAYNRNGMLFDRNKQTTSEEVTNLAGRKYMHLVAGHLDIPSPLLDSGMQVFRLASANNFIQGRRTRSVAAVSLYLACRAQRNARNTHMLIDFADILELNVFHLGQIYKGLIKVIRINEHNYYVPPMNPEDLILRFAQRLEFGTEHMKVANDAVRIVQRMTRDWLTHGRRPAGICGAALILAARMNNFRRTVREVVYVVKVQEQTIFKRLDEFKVTESSGLTVEEFRTIDLEREAEPPAFYEQQNSGTKKKTRKRKHENFDDDGDDPEPSQAGSRTSSVAPSNVSRATSTVPASGSSESAAPANTQHALADSQSMPPPPLPIDPNLLEVSAQALSEMGGSPAPDSQASASRTKDSSLDETAPTTTQKGKVETKAIPKKRGRPKKVIDTPPVSQRPLDEAESESQLLSALTDPLNVDSTMALDVTVDRTITPSTPPATQAHLTTDTYETHTKTPTKPSKVIPNTADIADEEFSNDPEVTNCLLTPHEVSIKTHIWTAENRDWLRQQSAKAHKTALAEANGTARIIKRRIRRRGRVGDMRPYGVGDDGGIQAGSPVANTPEEAVKKMLGVRGYSKKLNYEYLKGVYSPRGGSRGTSTQGAGSPGSGGAATSPLARASGSPSVEPEEGREGRREFEEGPVEEQDALSEAGTVNDERQREVEKLVEELQAEGVYDDDDDEAMEDYVGDSD